MATKFLAGRIKGKGKPCGLRCEVSMLTNMERQIIEAIVERLRNDPSLVPEAHNHLEALRPWLARFVIAPLEMVADETRIYDRYDRLMQLESARSLSKTHVGPVSVEVSRPFSRNDVKGSSSFILGNSMSAPAWIAATTNSLATVGAANNIDGQLATEAATTHTEPALRDTRGRYHKWLK
jgi:hypothetical protein